MSATGTSRSRGLGVTVQVFVELSCVASVVVVAGARNESATTRHPKGDTDFHLVPSFTIHFAFWLPRVRAAHHSNQLRKLLTRTPHSSLCAAAAFALHPLRPHRAPLLSSCARVDKHRSRSRRGGGGRQRKLVASQVLLEVPFEVTGHELGCALQGTDGRPSRTSSLFHLATRPEACGEAGCKNICAAARQGRAERWLRA